MNGWEPGAVLEKTSASPPALPIHRTLYQLLLGSKNSGEGGQWLVLTKRKTSNIQNFLVTFNYHIYFSHWGCQVVMEAKYLLFHSFMVDSSKWGKQVFLVWAACHAYLTKWCHEIHYWLVFHIWGVQQHFNQPVCASQIPSIAPSHFSARPFSFRVAGSLAGITNHDGL